MVIRKFFNKRKYSFFWGTGNHPIELCSNSVINQKLDYLHHNPIKEELVFGTEQYVYSSAVDDAGEKG